MLDAASDPSTPWIVAIGASAGGLEALQQFFAELSPPTRASFVVLQHLAPDHKSLMAELLGRHTPLRVMTATEGTALAEDTVYLLPPAVSMTVDTQGLHLEPRPAHGVALPIDLFFQSLARTCAERAIGVVLSGSGSDGSTGAEALRRAGAYVLVQDPASARFDSMPRSVLARTPVDACLPPDALARTARDIVAGAAGRLGQGELVASQQVRPALQRIFDQLLTRSGIDFNAYKLPTVMRRIERRMRVTQLHSVSDYADRIEGSADECEHLRRELLIPVTSFFRDPETFRLLTEQVLLPMVRQKGASQPIRVWSAGCASGEEAYSLAMALTECCEQAGMWPGFKVFATDIDTRVLEVAMLGSYPAKSAEALGDARVRRFFETQGERLTVRPELRQLVLFARHNLLDDAPFTRMDLVVCRNTLIYLQPEAQERVMRRLQYALVPKGLLFLGSSESLGELQGDFSVVQPPHKIYRLERPVTDHLALHDAFARPAGPARRGLGDGRLPRNSLIEDGLNLLLQAYVPASLLVNGQRQLLHAWGDTRRFLRMPEGAGTLDAFRMLPDRLGPLAAQLQQLALRSGGTQRSAPVQLDIDGTALEVTVAARCLAVEDGPACVLLTLEASPAADAPPTALAGQPADADAGLGALERELSMTRQSLQATIEELESSNEELQSTNEELMSSNEELQSTNEELQSVNEELYTVNAEFNAKLDALAALNADLEGMAQATGMATLFMDNRLQLLRFTPEAAMLFRLRSGDAGRSIEDFNHLLDYPDLAADLRRSLTQDGTTEREVEGPHGSAYLARMLSYAERPGQARRIVLSLIDISRVRDASRLQGLIDSLPEHIAVLDRQGTIRRVNRAWLDFACGNGAEGDVNCQVGANYLAVLARTAEPQARKALDGLQAVLSGALPRFSMVYPCHSATVQRWFVMHAQPLQGPDDGMVVTHFDLSLAGERPAGPSETAT